MKVKALAAVLGALAMMISAQASLVTLTSADQLDYNDIQLNSMQVITNGYAVNFGSGAPDGVFVRGLRFQSAGAGYGLAGLLPGLTFTAAEVPYADVTWSAQNAQQPNLGARPTIGGTDGANLRTMCEDFDWVGHYHLAVTAGQEYRLQVFGSNPANNTNGPPALISIDGNAATVTPDSGTSWLYTTTFTASKANILLELGNLAAPYMCPEAGGMILTAVPEPATMSLIGLGSLALLRRRR